MHLLLRLAACSLVTSAFALAACGGGGAQPKGAESASAASRVDVAEMQITIGDTTVKIHGDGAVEGPKGEAVGTLTRDGRLVAKSGKAAVTLKDDGHVEMPDQGDVVITLADDGALTLSVKTETVTYRIGDDGVVTDGKEPTPIKVQGADTVGKKRAAMIFIAPFTFARPKKE
jgi:hypothetical protein